MNTTCSNNLELRIPADKRFISLVRRGVRSVAESAGFPREDVADVEVAVSEAVTNSVVHGSPNPDTAGVIVKCHTTGNYLVIEIEDHSEAEQIPQKPDNPDELKESGRGMIMMHALMDECCDSRTETGIKVRMAKQKAPK